MIQKIPDPEQEPRPAKARGKASAEAPPEDPGAAAERGVVAALSEETGEADEPGDERAESVAEAAAEAPPAADVPDQARAEAQDEPREPVGDVTSAEGPGARDGLPLTRRVEAVLFAASGPLAPRRLANVLDVRLEEVKAALDALVERWAGRDTSMELMAIAGGYRFMTRPIHAEDLAGLAKKGRTENLSPAALETLAVVAYRQPIGRAEIEGIRGVAAGPLLRVLLDRDLIRIAGRSKEPGHPLLYGTTKRFLDHFGLKSLKQLPDLKDLLDVR